MDLQQPGHVSLSRGERALMGMALAGMAGLGWRFYDGVTEKLERVAVEQAVTNQRLHDLTVQMADIPALKLEVAKQGVELDQVKTDVRELKQTRGLK
jgi:hypothetical protein